VRGTAAVALIDAVGIGIGLAIVGVPLVLPLSLLVFFGGFVPVVGAFVTGILAVLVALASNGLQSALIVTGIVIAVQQIESNVLQPTIMRRAVALHPVVTLTVLVAGTMLIGIIGAFLAVPVTAVIAAVANELRLRKESRRLGIEVGPQPLGGPGVDQELLMPAFPESRPVRPRRPRVSGRVRRTPASGRRGRRRRRGRRPTVVPRHAPGRRIRRRSPRDPGPRTPSLRRGPDTFRRAPRHDPRAGGPGASAPSLAAGQAAGTCHPGAWRVHGTSDSSSAATASTSSSRPGPATIWTASGRPRSCHSGTLAAGTSARFHAAVNG
jgi:hypothetical protein